MFSDVEINITKLHSSAIVPFYAHGSREDAGMDLHACIDAPVLLEPFKPVAIPTGFSLEIPEGWHGEVRSRSGLALKHGIQVLNAPGTIDPGYRGEVKVILGWNGHSTNCTPYFIVSPGDRIAQLVITPYGSAQFTEITPNLAASSTRGVGGFGSTGMSGGGGSGSR